MRSLLPLAEKVAALLKPANQTVAVAESAAGGLINAALLTVAGASAYALGGQVIYTRQAWRALRDFDDSLLKGIRPGTEEHALIRARLIRGRFGADWGIGETSAAGPTGNRYGDPAGHACIAIVGSGTERALTVETAATDRIGNMYAFAGAALRLFADVLQSPR